MNYSPLHSFHIPVMGLAYTIDSPIKVAHYGISSVVSIVEDRLVEMMRRHYYPTVNKEYQPIATSEPDYRAKRITDYLNLVNSIVQSNIDKLKHAAFEAGSEIVKYFELLPEESSLKKMYRQMMHSNNDTEKKNLEAYLRSNIKPGNIDVNIMTKIDRNNYDEAGVLIDEGSDAVSALRGFAQSELHNAAVIFSAGMNPRLYNYLESCTAFNVNEDGDFTKKVIIKVSDYRSALIQGKYLAKKGIWVSGFRVESGLNCGGHAFATEGYLMGPILEEFKTRKQELVDTLFEIYNAALEKKTGKKFIYPPAMSLSAQGGIGTYEEDQLLQKEFGVESTGWGTPFLLVPEATTVDEQTLQLLIAATESDVVLSHNSPLGVRFNTLKGTTAEAEKQQRIVAKKPGSPCTEKHLAFNTEFTSEPICTASHKYQKLKLEQLKSFNLPANEYQKQVDEVLAKECLCIGLSNAAALSYDETMVKKLNAVSICPGPNIANFSKVVSLQTMVDHIYGRANLVTNDNRPHMFIAELYLYIDYLKEQLQEDAHTDRFEKRKKYFASYCQNLLNGIAYYKKLQGLSVRSRKPFLEALYAAELEIAGLNYQYEVILQSAGNGELAV
jgi:hypothetical protein